jgi:SAM-dependent methyltransferase
MSKVTNTGISPVAMQRMIGVLEPEIGSQWRAEEGHIDLLGERDPIGPSLMQQSMRSRIVPRIYERVWRPVLSRSFYGLFGPRHADECRIALGMLDISPDDFVLDVGCGPGNFTREFARVASDGLVVGLDASETMLSVAVKREATPNLAYVRGDACALPFGESSFDAVCCFGTLHLVNDPIKALDEMTKVLAPGGRLGLMATWNRKGPSPGVKKGIRVFGREELTNALADRGFAAIDQRVARWGQFVSARKPEE